MPEARDRRRPTAVDVAAAFARRRASIFGVSELDPLLIGPVRAPELSPSPGSGRLGVQRLAIYRDRARPLHAPGVENTSPVTVRRGRARGSSRSVLPSWYPRTPLRDITAIVRAIERRRARTGNEEQQTETPIRIHSDEQLLSDPSSSASSSRPVFVDHTTPKVGIKIRTPYGSKIPKILLDFSYLEQEEGDSEFLTPQKKLLNSIDKVEEVVKQELQKLKRTPSAKKAEREKKVRTLMSMR